MPNLLSDTPFLPATAPANPIVDCARVLSSARLSRLNAQAAQACFKPRVVILPPDFAPRSMAQLSSNIAQQWHMPGDSLLIVINLRGHDLRIVPGPTLKSKGLTDKNIAHIIATQFGPPMRNVHSADSLSAALPESISNTINGANEALGHGKIAAVQTSRAPANMLAQLEPGASQPLAVINWLIPVAVIAALLLSFLYLRRRQ